MIGTEADERLWAQHVAEQARREADERLWAQRIAEQKRRDAAVDDPAPFEAFQRANAALESKRQRDLQAAGHAERGLAIILSGEIAGLPTDLVARAQAAGAAVKQATQRHIQLMEEADQYARRHGLRPEAAATYKELFCAEAGTLRREADDAAKQACQRLGAAAEQLARADAMEVSLPQRRQDAERQYHAQLEQIDQDAATVRAVRRELGV